MRKFLALLVVTLSAGCSSTKTYDLDESWAPLKGITERPGLLADMASEDIITTVGEYAYVKDLDQWLSDNPPNEAHFKAMMRHEQEHSRRQLKTGTWLWIAHYMADTDFALLEEQIGYYYEITERRRLGGTVVPFLYARMLSSYQTLAGRLISYQEALDWVNAVLSGRWYPPTH